MASFGSTSDLVIPTDLIHSIFQAATASIHFTTCMIEIATTYADERLFADTGADRRQQLSTIRVDLGGIRTRLKSTLSKLKESSVEGGCHTLSIVELSQSCSVCCDGLVGMSTKINDGDASKLRLESLATLLQDDGRLEEIRTIQTEMKLAVTNLISHYHTIYRTNVQRLTVNFHRISKSSPERLKLMEVSLTQLIEARSRIIESQLDCQSDVSEAGRLLELLAKEKVAAMTEIWVLQHLRRFNDRLHLIPEAHNNTFKWVLSHEGLSAWLSSGNGVFWITGKPGSGKSTLMKFIASNPEMNNILNIYSGPKKVTIATHFLWSRGTTSEHSFEGIIRSLLFNIIKQHPSYALFIFPVLWPEAQGQIPLHRDTSDSTSWPISQLVDSLKTLLKETCDTNNFYLFIDDLDEYIDTGHREPFKLLLELTNFPNCKICVASRPSLHILDGFCRTPDLRVEDYTEVDVVTYARDSLATSPYSEDVNRSLAENVSSNSHGVFLWTHLATRSILEGFQFHDSLSVIQARIGHLPNELYVLYEDMLEHAPDYKDDSYILRVANAARDPLQVPIYHFLHMEHDNAKYALEMPTTQFLDVTYEIQNHTIRWLIGRTNGFLEVNKQRGVITWFHPTVKEFLDAPKIREKLTTANPCSPFLSLFKAHIAAMKSGFDPQHMLEDALYYAAQLDNSDGRDQSVYFEHLFDLESVIFEAQDTRHKKESKLPSVVEFKSLLARYSFDNYVRWKKEGSKQLEIHSSRHVKPPLQTSDESVISQAYYQEVTTKQDPWESSDEESEISEEQQAYQTQVESQSKLTDLDSQSEPTYAASIFSRPNGFVSEISELSFGNIRTARDELVGIFLSDLELNRLFVAAIEDPNIGGQRLERNFRRLLVTYSQELLFLSKGNLHREIAKFVRRSAPFIAEDVRRHIDPTDHLTESRIDTKKDDETAGKREVLSRFISKEFRDDAPLNWIPVPPIRDDGERDEKQAHNLDSESDALSDIFEDQNVNDGIMAALEHTKNFLRAGHPFENLKISLRGFVIPKTPTTTHDAKAIQSEERPPEISHANEVMNNSTNRVFPCLPALVDYLVTFLSKNIIAKEPPVPPGKSRVRWICNCGLRLYDDYVELIPGSLREFENELRAVNQPHTTPGAGGEGPLSWASTIGGSLKQAFQIPLEVWRASQNVSLPVYHKHHHSTSGNVPADTKILHVLYCIHDSRTGVRFHQERLQSIQTDKELFLFLKALYYKHRNLLTWFRLRTVSKVKLNRFEVDLSLFAQIHDHERSCASDSCICLPPLEKIDHEYSCQPVPQKPPTRIPIYGENYLIHFLKNPQCLDEKQKSIFQQLPKRTCGGLSIADEQQPTVGWGVYFEEGWHWESIYFIIAVFVTGSLVFGIAWTVSKGDIQGAFAISAYWVTLGSLLLGYLAIRSS